MEEKIFIFLAIFQLISGAKIPPYFSRCSKTDPKVNDCIAYNANGGLYAFVKGDKTYNIQSMLPIYIPHIALKPDKQLKINITNSIISDLEGAKIKDARVDLYDKNIELSMYMPRATLLGQYHIKGKISILPIDERGPVNITVLHSRIKYNFSYELLERKGLHYMNITKSSMNYKSERAFFKFYNLFEAHEFLGGYIIEIRTYLLPNLGDVINDSLNENWFETNKEISPAVSDSLCKITTSSLKGFFEKVPYEELLGE